MSYESCPACSCTAAVVVSARIYSCTACEALYGNCNLGASYEYVLPQMTTVEPEQSRYFDFTCIGSKGITRRHGWYDPATKLITQVG